MKEEVVEVQCGIPQESIAYRHLQLSAILMVSNGEESFAIESLPLICHPYIYVRYFKASLKSCFYRWATTQEIYRDRIIIIMPSVPH